MKLFEISYHTMELIITWIFLKAFWFITMDFNCPYGGWHTVWWFSVWYTSHSKQDSLYKQVVIGLTLPLYSPVMGSLIDYITTIKMCIFYIQNSWSAILCIPFATHIHLVHRINIATAHLLAVLHCKYTTMIKYL